MSLTTVMCINQNNDLNDNKPIFPNNVTITSDTKSFLDLATEQNEDTSLNGNLKAHSVASDVLTKNE